MDAIHIVELEWISAEDAIALFPRMRPHYMACFNRYGVDDGGTLWVWSKDDSWAYWQWLPIEKFWRTWMNGRPFDDNVWQGFGPTPTPTT